MDSPTVDLQRRMRWHWSSTPEHLLEHLSHLFDGGLRVAENHVGVAVEEQWVVHISVAPGQRPLQYQHLARPPHLIVGGVTVQGIRVRVYCTRV